jgi:hypothetical protein
VVTAEIGVTTSILAGHSHGSFILLLKRQFTCGGKIQIDTLPDELGDGTPLLLSDPFQGPSLSLS